MTDEKAASLELIGAIRSLYRRAREQALTADDIISLEDVTVSETADFLERIYIDEKLFEHHLGDLAKGYEVFRVFEGAETVLDVGAHWGYSVAAMRHRGCRSKIISIEALATNVPSMMWLKGFEGEKYDFYHAAASDCGGSLRLFVPVINRRALTGLATSGGTLRDEFASLFAELAVKHSLVRNGANEVRLASTNVPTLRIDDIAGQLGCVAAIKMDIEGHEARALHGAREILSVYKPLLMLEGGNRDERVVADVIGRGYFYCELHDGKLVRHNRRSLVTNGYWLHRDKVQRYCELGILDPPGP